MKQKLMPRTPTENMVHSAAWVGYNETGKQIPWSIVERIYEAMYVACSEKESGSSDTPA